MEETLIVALVVSCVALAAFAFFALMFRRGALLFLLAGNAAVDGEHDEACRKLGRRMAVALAVGCALLATLALFQGAELARNAPLATVASLANNVAFFALIVAVIWFFIVQRPNADEGGGKTARAGLPRSASLDHLHAATIVFVVVMLAVIGVVGMVAAGA